VSDLTYKWHFSSLVSICDEKIRDLRSYKFKLLIIIEHVGDGRKRVVENGALYIRCCGV
jgi:hypothetical protein